MAGGRVALAVVAEVDVDEVPLHRGQDHERVGAGLGGLEGVEGEADRPGRSQLRQAGGEADHVAHRRQHAPGDVLDRQRHPGLAAGDRQLLRRGQEPVHRAGVGDLLAGEPVPDDGAGAEFRRRLDRPAEERRPLLGPPPVGRHHRVERLEGVEGVDAATGGGDVRRHLRDEGRGVLAGRLQQQLQIRQAQLGGDGRDRLRWRRRG